MMEFLTAPIPVWVLLLGSIALIVGAGAIVLSVKVPPHEDHPHP